MNQKLFLKRLLFSIIINVVIGFSVLFLAFKSETWGTIGLMALEFAVVAALLHFLILKIISPKINWHLSPRIYSLQLIGVVLLFICLLSSIVTAFVFLSFTGLYIGILFMIGLWQWTIPMLFINFFLFRWILKS